MKKRILCLTLGLMMGATALGGCAPAATLGQYEAGQNTSAQAASITSSTNGKTLNLLSGDVLDFVTSYQINVTKPHSTGYTDGTTKTNPTPAHIEWEDTQSAYAYTVKLSTNADMSEAKSYSTIKNSVDVEDLFMGTKYYYQVYAHRADKTVKSQIFSFTTAHMPRTIKLDTTYLDSNVRDVGGYYTEDGNYRVKQGIAYRGAEVRHYTDEAKDKLVYELGIKTELAVHNEETLLDIGASYLPLMENGVLMTTAQVQAKYSSISFQVYLQPGESVNVPNTEGSAKNVGTTASWTTISLSTSNLINGVNHKEGAGLRVEGKSGTIAFFDDVHGTLKNGSGSEILNDMSVDFSANAWHTTSSLSTASDAVGAGYVKVAFYEDFNLNCVQTAGPHYVEAAGIAFYDEQTQENLKKELLVFAEPTNFPVFFHCQLGRDRTGTLAFVLGALLGVGFDDLCLDYELSYLTQYGGYGWTGDNCAENKFHQFVVMHQFINEGSCTNWTGYTLKNNHFNANDKTLAERMATYLKGAIGITDAQITAIRNNMLEEV